MKLLSETEIQKFRKCQTLTDQENTGTIDSASNSIKSNGLEKFQLSENIVQEKLGCTVKLDNDEHRYLLSACYHYLLTNDTQWNNLDLKDQSTIFLLFSASLHLHNRQVKMSNCFKNSAALFFNGISILSIANPPIGAAAGGLGLILGAIGDKKESEGITREVMEKFSKELFRGECLFALLNQAPLIASTGREYIDNNTRAEFAGLLSSSVSLPHNSSKLPSFSSALTPDVLSSTGSTLPEGTQSPSITSESNDALESVQNDLAQHLKESIAKKEDFFHAYKSGQLDVVLDISNSIANALYQYQQTEHLEEQRNRALQAFNNELMNVQQAYRLELNSRKYQMNCGSLPTIEKDIYQQLSSDIYGDLLRKEIQFNTMIDNLSIYRARVNHLQSTAKSHEVDIERFQQEQRRIVTKLKSIRSIRQSILSQGCTIARLMPLGPADGILKLADTVINCLSSMSDQRRDKKVARGQQKISILSNYIATYDALHRDIAHRVTAVNDVIFQMQESVDSQFSMTNDPEKYRNELMDRRDHEIKNLDHLYNETKKYQDDQDNLNKKYLKHNSQWKQFEDFLAKGVRPKEEDISKKKRQLYGEDYFAEKARIEHGQQAIMEQIHNTENNINSISTKIEKLDRLKSKDSWLYETHTRMQQQRELKYEGMSETEKAEQKRANEEQQALDHISSANYQDALAAFQNEKRVKDEFFDQMGLLFHSLQPFIGEKPSRILMMYTTCDRVYHLFRFTEKNAFSHLRTIIENPNSDSEANTNFVHRWHQSIVKFGIQNFFQQVVNPTLLGFNCIMTMYSVMTCSSITLENVNYNLVNMQNHLVKLITEVHSCLSKQLDGISSQLQGLGAQVQFLLSFNKERHTKISKQLLSENQKVINNQISIKMDGLIQDTKKDSDKILDLSAQFAHNEISITTKNDELCESLRKLADAVKRADIEVWDGTLEGSNSQHLLKAEYPHYFIKTVARQNNNPSPLVQNYYILYAALKSTDKLFRQLIKQYCQTQDTTTLPPVLHKYFKEKQQDISKYLDIIMTSAEQLNKYLISLLGQTDWLRKIVSDIFKDYTSLLKASDKQLKSLFQYDRSSNQNLKDYKAMHESMKNNFIGYFKFKCHALPSDETSYQNLYFLIQCLNFRHNRSQSLWGIFHLVFCYSFTALIYLDPVSDKIIFGNRLRDRIQQNIIPDASPLIIDSDYIKVDSNVITSHRIKINLISALIYTLWPNRYHYLWDYEYGHTKKIHKDKFHEDPIISQHDRKVFQYLDSVKKFINDYFDILEKVATPATDNDNQNLMFNGIDVSKGEIIECSTDNGIPLIFPTEYLLKLKKHSEIFDLDSIEKFFNLSFTYSFIPSLDQAQNIAWHLILHYHIGDNHNKKRFNIIDMVIAIFDEASVGMYCKVVSSDQEGIHKKLVHNPSEFLLIAMYGSPNTMPAIDSGINPGLPGKYSIYRNSPVLLHIPQELPFAGLYLFLIKCGNSKMFIFNHKNYDDVVSLEFMSFVKSNNSDVSNNLKLFIEDSKPLEASGYYDFQQYLLDQSEYFYEKLKNDSSCQEILKNLLKNYEMLVSLCRLISNIDYDSAARIIENHFGIIHPYLLDLFAKDDYVNYFMNLMRLQERENSQHEQKVAKLHEYLNSVKSMIISDLQNLIQNLKKHDSILKGEASLNAELKFAESTDYKTIDDSTETKKTIKTLQNRLKEQAASVTLPRIPLLSSSLGCTIFGKANVDADGNQAQSQPTLRQRRTAAVSTSR